MNRTFFLSLFALVSFAAGARADQAPKTDEAMAYSFEDELVRGDLYSADSEQLRVRKRSGRQSLIEVRSSYVPELLRSIEDM